MQTITHSISDLNYSPRFSENACILDIQTEGRYWRISHLISVSVIFLEDNAPVLRTWLSEKEADEYDILYGLSRFLAGKSPLLTFNGTSFDLPHLSRKFAAYRIADPLPGKDHQDLYLALRPLNAVLPIRSHRLADYLTCLEGPADSVEGPEAEKLTDSAGMPKAEKLTDSPGRPKAFWGSRGTPEASNPPEDQKTSMSSSESQKTYAASRGAPEASNPPEARKTSMGSSESSKTYAVSTGAPAQPGDRGIGPGELQEPSFSGSDAVRTLRLTALLDFLDFLKGDFVTGQALVTDGCLLVPLASDHLLPPALVISDGPFSLAVSGKGAMLAAELTDGKLRRYYTNISDYDYLPLEGCAVHRSVSAYVGRSRKEKAVRENCFTLFSCTPAFISDAKALGKYVSSVLAYLLTKPGPSAARQDAEETSSREK